MNFIAIKKDFIMGNSGEQGAFAAGFNGEATENRDSFENGDVKVGDADLKGEESFEELINGKFKDEFSKRVQTIIDKRFKRTKELKSFFDGANPIIEELSKRLGTKNGDFDALKEVLFKEVEEVGGENAGDNENADEKTEYEKGLLEALFDEEKSLRELYPDFDLRNELKGELFSRLLRSGLTVKDAFEAAHKDEIISGAMAYTARAVREQLAGSLEMKSRRPLENGLLSSSAAVTKTNVNSLTSDDILKIIKQVEKGAKIEF